MTGTYSSGRLARILGWCSLAAFGLILIGLVVPVAGIATGLPPFASVAMALQQLMAIVVVVGVLASLGAFVLGLAAVVTGEDRGDGLVGVLAALPLLAVGVLAVLALIALATSDTPWFG
jgi:hypothetical protein